MIADTFGEDAKVIADEPDIRFVKHETKSFEGILPVYVLDDIRKVRLGRRGGASGAAKKKGVDTDG